MERSIPTGTRFVSQRLVTDVVTYEVVSETPKTLRVRRCNAGSAVRHEGPGYGRVWAEAIPSELNPVSTVRLRKDGTFRMQDGLPPMHAAEYIDGVPTSYTDYNY